MADVRCPMCSKPNPEEAEVCEFCSARLKPLIIDQSAEEPAAPSEEPSVPEEEKESEGPPQVSDWLSHFRSEMAAEEQAEEGEVEEDQGPGTGEMQDLLGRLRDIGQEEEPAEAPAEEPTPEAAPGDPEKPQREVEETAEVPDWLARIRAKKRLESQTPSEGRRQESDWLAGLRGESEGERREAEEEEEAEAPWPPTFDQEEAEAAGEPEGEEEPGAPPREGELRGPPSDEELFPSSGIGLGDAASLDDLFADYEMVEPEDTGGADIFAGVDREALEAEGESPAAEEPEPAEEPGPPAFEGESWPFDMVEEEGAEDLEGPAIPPEPEAAEPAESPEAEAPEPGPLERPEPMEPGVREEGVGEAPRRPHSEGEAEAVEGEGEEPEQKEEALPHVPALILDDMEVDFEEEEFTDVPDLDAGEIPDWLEQLKAETDTDTSIVPAAPEEGEPELAPATLPAWLEAMRPIETFRTSPEAEEGEEEIIEAAGPLAGLKGVLLAEPVVAMPRSPTRGRPALEVTERQQRQAEILSQLVEEEQRETPAAAPRRRALPVLRWVVAVLMLLATALPGVAGVPAFGAPTRAPRDVAQFLDLVSGLPTETPVLLVLEYPPGYVAEMDAVAGPFLEHLVRRGQPIVALSTRPTGPLLADRVFRDYTASKGLENGRDFVNLGYLPGGATAVQLFARDPQSASLRGFRLPADPEIAVWDTELMRRISSLSDFGMVAVIAAGAQDMRPWVEQLGPLLGETPLLIVASAGTEPMVRPYYESRSPQVAGLLSGLPSGLIYERTLGESAAAAGRWNAYGAGVLTAAAVLLTGMSYGLFVWLGLRGRRSED